jgi:hypothetical protein
MSGPESEKSVTKLSKKENERNVMTKKMSQKMSKRSNQLRKM